MQRVGEALCETFEEAYLGARKAGRGQAVIFIARAFVDLLFQLLAERIQQARGIEPYGVDRAALAPQGRRRTEMHRSHGIAQDTKFALRALRKAPGFTAVAVVTLALAIGANGAMFSLVKGILLNPLPYADSQRIVQLTGSSRGEEMNRHSYPNFLDYAERSEAIDHLAPIQEWAATVHFEHSRTDVKYRHRNSEGCAGCVKRKGAC